MILGLRTDTGTVVISLVREKNIVTTHERVLDRNMARDLLGEIESSLQKIDSDWRDIHGLVYYSGPGSFTSLRISAAIVNSLVYALHVPIAVVNSEDWLPEGVARIAKGEDDRIALPYYGAPPRITLPRK